MPSGLADMLGARGMLDAPDGSLRRGADTASAATGRMASTMSDTARGAGQVGYRAARRPLIASWPLSILGRRAGGTSLVFSGRTRTAAG